MLNILQKELNTKANQVTKIEQNYNSLIADYERLMKKLNSDVSTLYQMSYKNKDLEKIVSVWPESYQLESHKLEHQEMYYNKKTVEFEQILSNQIVSFMRTLQEVENNLHNAEKN